MIIAYFSLDIGRFTVERIARKRKRELSGSVFFFPTPVVMKHECHRSEDATNTGYIQLKKSHMSGNTIVSRGKRCEYHD